jgi:hypothetical protein
VSPHNTRDTESLDFVRKYKMPPIHINSILNIKKKLLKIGIKKTDAVRRVKRICNAIRSFPIDFKRFSSLGFSLLAWNDNNAYKKTIVKKTTCHRKTGKRGICKLYLIFK